MLATLYRELCQATEPNKMLIDGCLLLLYSWAWWQLPSTSPSKRPLYIPIGDKVEPWVELYGTTKAARRYPTVVGSMLKSWC
ncbi:serine/threonine-protein phosphatase 7 long form-like protein [Gossypium australe]|uniref:Serine/threonine-protein phosphatase 7 long form-like protein n=1 Tax=Gossypium australe TaxID=47621 RepID=A0A5B6W6H9_9ROSI|nr:serine/threonine-protein phosphatase 7 long form-like protein [Gossypium australe]